MTLKELSQLYRLNEHKLLEHYIDDIPDNLIRKILTLRFINRLPWQCIAVKIGGGNTADNVRIMCHRYLSATNKN